MKKRIAAILCVTAMAIGQVYFIVPGIVHAEEGSGVAGEVLSVRVQYAGEREDKIREKASFTSAQLNNMGAAVYRYTNVTDVGTVLQIVAVGPELVDVIEAAGIDLNSVKTINFRTTDGSGTHSQYSRNFDVGKHLTSTRYYYPNLPKNYERDSDNQTLTPLPGSLDGAKTVPSILALRSASTKNPNSVLSESEMDLSEAFRFCLGQTPLKEGLETIPGYDGGDVNAMDSAQYIYGIDITLYGSPVEGIQLDLNQDDLKVGSKKKISAVIKGDELFADEFGFTADDLTWSSSNPEIVSVDADGTITVLKEGSATITATAPNGMTASITINASKDGSQSGVATGSDKEGDKQESGKADKKTSKKANEIVVKEVTIEELTAEDTGGNDTERQQMASDAQALDAADETSPVAIFMSGYTAVLAVSFGATLRIRRYFMEV